MPDQVNIAAIENNIRQMVKIKRDLATMSEELGSIIKAFLSGECTEKRAKTVSKLFEIRTDIDKAAKRMDFMKEYYEGLSKIL